MSRPATKLAPRFSWLGPALAATLLLVPRIAMAQGGINLSWNDCGPFGSVQRNFACNTNAGSATLVISAVAPQPMSHVNGMAASIEIALGGSSVSPWWRLDPSGCRAGSLSASFDFTGGSGGCYDLWKGAAVGAVSYGYDLTYQPPISAGARIDVSASVATPVAMDGVSEYDLAGVTIDYARSTGDGACAGCADVACLVLPCLRLSQSDGLPSFILTVPLIRLYVAFNWQAGFPYDCPPMSVACPGSVPARSPTWGQIKALYR